MTRRTTLALDEGTVARLKKLASRWHVSPAEAVSRSLEKADQAEQAAPLSPDIERRLAAARELRESVRAKISAEEWMAMIKDGRR